MDVNKHNFAIYGKYPLTRSHLGKIIINDRMHGIYGMHGRGCKNPKLVKEVSEKFNFLDKLIPSRLLESKGYAIIKETARIISAISPESMSGRAIELILRAIVATAAAVASLGAGGDIIVNTLFTIKKGLFFIASVILFFDDFFQTISVAKEDIADTVQIGTEDELTKMKEAAESKGMTENTQELIESVKIEEIKDDVEIANELNQKENIDEKIDLPPEKEEEIEVKEGGELMLSNFSGGERVMDPDLKRFVADIFQIDFKCGPNGVGIWVKKIFKTYKFEGRNLPICDVLAPIYPAFSGFISNAIGGLVPDIGVVAVTTIEMLLSSRRGRKLILKGLIFIVNTFYKQIPAKYRKMIQNPDLFAKKIIKTFTKLKFQIRYLIGLKVSKYAKKKCFLAAHDKGKEIGAENGLNDKYALILENEENDIDEKIKLDEDRLNAMKETIPEKFNQYYNSTTDKKEMKCTSKNHQCCYEGFEYGYILGYHNGFGRSKKHIERIKKDLPKEVETFEEEIPDELPENIPQEEIPENIRKEIQEEIEEKRNNPENQEGSLEGGFNPMSLNPAAMVYEKLMKSIAKKVAKKVARKIAVALKLNKLLEKRIVYIESMIEYIMEKVTMLVHMVTKLIAFAYALMYIIKECA